MPWHDRLSGLTLKPTEACTNIIKQWEGIEDGDPTTVKLDPYLDPVGLLTIGWGHLIRPGIDDHLLEGITYEEAEKLLEDDTREAVNAVRHLVDVLMSQEMFDGLVSFTFNVGGRALAESTLLRHLNEGDYMEIPEQMMRWRKSKGRDLRGLLRRRISEADLYTR